MTPTQQNARPRLLIVDDEEFNRELLEANLKLLGYDTCSAADGAEAFQQLGPNTDLVLLDATMPGMNGFEVVRRMREHPLYWDVPVIMVTALSAREDRLRAAEMGANDFLCKPVDMTELKVRTASLLRMKAAQDAVKRHGENLERLVAERTAELQAAHDRLEALATTDPLTGLPNHRSLVTALDGELERAQRFQREFAALFIDLDHFKSLNDGFGHAAGDAALASFGRIARSCIRGMDVLGRWGGEEFVLILPETGRERALEAAEQIREALAVHRFDAIAARLTCSIGVAVYPADGVTRSEIVRAADRAMYAAKRLGRDQVRSATDPAIVATSADFDSREAATLEGEVEALALLVASRDCYTGRHTDSVADLARAVAAAMGLSDAEVHMVALVGQLHDIGKVAIPDAVLQKPGPLDDWEWQQMRRHPVVGAEVVSRLPTLRVIARSIRAHHERWDGSGYPDGLAGGDIPLAARIVAVADAFGAITTDRPYSKARSIDLALAELENCAGTHFDPEVVAAFKDTVCHLQNEPRRAA